MCNTSWLKYNDYYCVYNGSDIADGCTKTTPANAEVATDSSSSTSSLPATIATCPECKFVFTTDTLTIGTSEATGAVDNYTTLNKNYFLGVITNDNNVITRAFACGIENGTPFCLEGTRGSSKYANPNITTLNTIYPSCNADASVSSAYCYGSSVNAGGSSEGSVAVWDDIIRCNVTDNSTARCREL